MQHAVPDVASGLEGWMIKGVDSGKGARGWIMGGPMRFGRVLGCGLGRSKGLATQERV